MCDISFLTLTNRPYEEVAKVGIDSIKECLKAYPIKYSAEFLICSPDEIKDENVAWVKDEINQSGNAGYCINKMFQHSKGKYIFALNDDYVFPDPKPLKAVEFLKSEVFNGKRFKVTSIGAGRGTTCYTGTCVPSLAFPPPYPLSEELKDPKYTQAPHRHLIMGYPVFERQTVLKELRAHLVNPSFKHHYSDNWLPFFIGESGEEVQICDDTSLRGLIGHVNEDINDEFDYNVFCRLVRDFVNGTNKEYV